MFRVKRSYIILIIFIGVVLVIASLYSTFAFNSKVEEAEDSYAVTLTGSSEVVTLKGNSSKTVFYRVTNTNRGKVSYGLAYKGSNITVKVYSDYYEDVKGTLDYGQSKFTELYIENNSSSENNVTISTVLGYENGGDLIVPNEYTLVTEKYFPLYGLAKYITDLYNKGSKEEVINNNITYRYAPSESLMNDRLGGVTESLDGGNIRYYGTSPNNYIYFNCDDYDNQTSDTCELWRIIGVFDGKVKIIRDDSIGTMAWDETRNNDWERPATLNAYLNGEYYNSLKNNYTRSVIEDSIWKLGAWDTARVYSNQIYNYERGDLKCNSCNYNTTWQGKIVPLYASDYGYATNFNVCTVDMYEYDTDSCINNNWLYKDTNRWTITLYNKVEMALPLAKNGKLGYASYTVSDRYAIFPSLYLVPDINFKNSIGSTGSINNPYQLEF